jgi:hypothetical protein
MLLFFVLFFFCRKSLDKLYMIIRKWVNHEPCVFETIKVKGLYHHSHEFQILHIYSLLDDNIPAPLKNAIDWASRPPNVWADKAAAIISASAGMGGARGQLHLRQIGVFIDLHFINKPEFFLNVFQPPAKFDSQGNLIDENTKERLKEVLLALQAFTWRLKNGNKCLTFAESGST